MTISPDIQDKLKRFKLQLTSSRYNPNTMIETVMRDDLGRLVKQDIIHISWHAHIDVCIKLKKFPIILAPFGHGKSMQIAVGRVLYELGRNPNLRIKMVCNTDNNSALRVETIKRYIQGAIYKELGFVFPHLKIDESKKNLAHEFTVVRDSGAIDPSIQSYGVFGSGISGRADLLIIDDIVDKKNTIINPALREKVTTTFWDTWYSRLDPVYGRCFGIGTVWAQNDLWSDLKKKEEFCVLEQSITDNCEAIDVKVYNAPEGYPETVRDLIEKGFEIWGQNIEEK